MIETRRRALVQNVLNADLPVAVRGRGVWLQDDAGRRYFDACSGAVVSALGHAHPRIVAAIADQAARLTFVHRGAFAPEPTLRLAERLTALTGYAAAWLVGSGSEAVEAAMQFALQYHRETGRPERQWFLSHRRGYHGNTLGGLSLSGHGRRAVVGDLAYAFAELEAPATRRDPSPAAERLHTDQLLAGARAALERNRDRIAAIVVEPVGGATLGATVPPDGYLPGLRSLADEFGALLVFDEVLSGMGRTGRVLAADHWGVRADLVALGKGLGAGYASIAGVLLDAPVLDAIAAGSGRIAGGHTYGGNPLAAATALAVLDVMEQERLVERAERTGAVLRLLLDRLAAAHPVVAEVRGIGMLQAVELELDPGAAPGVTAARFAENARAAGAIVYVATGGFLDAVLVAPPLVTTEAELQVLVGMLESALTTFESTVPSRGIQDRSRSEGGSGPDPARGLDIA
ncbi:aspartate aminotransferase family protein [uncultured Amnibacterium sp.]|uniref:aminotransferase family protein n=1 Tax=uncultured Amnibacterium sp. TaxID=1631851 RepID=UPI0035CA617A